MKYHLINAPFIAETLHNSIVTPHCRRAIGWLLELQNRILEAIQDPQLSEPSADCNPFQMFNFSASHAVLGEVWSSYVLALCHAVWEHASIGHLSVITQ